MVSLAGDAVIRARDTFVNAAGTTTKNFGLIVEDSYAITKLMKIIKNSLDISKRITGKLSKPLSAVRSQFGEATSLIDALQFFSVMKTIWCKDNNGKYFFNNDENSRLKKVGMAALGAAVTGGFVAQGERLGLYSLGRVSKATLCRIPVLGLVIRSTYGVYKVTSAIEATKKLLISRKDIKRTNKKIIKWEDRNNVINNLRKGDITGIAYLETKYARKVSEFQHQIDSKKEGANLTKLAQKVALYTERLEFIKNNQHDDLANSLDIGKLKGKITKYTNEKTKAEGQRKKNLMSLVESVSKVAATVLSLFAEAIACTALPLYLTYMSLGMISDVLGVKKFLMDKNSSSQVVKEKAPKPTTSVTPPTPGFSSPAPARS